MKLKSIILFVFIMLSGSGQPVAALQKPLGSGELILRVKSSEGPIEGASVVLSSGSAERLVTLTNSEGLCEFRALQPGIYSLKVVQRSFFPTAESEEQLNHLEIRNGQSRSLTVYLVKGGVLQGKLINEDGSPIIGMPVSALMLTGKAPSLPPATESNVTAISNDRGEYRVYGLRQGSYTVVINGKRQPGNATAFELLPGQEVDIPDMVLGKGVTDKPFEVGEVSERREGSNETSTGAAEIRGGPGAPVFQRHWLSPGRYYITIPARFLLIPPLELP